MKKIINLINILLVLAVFFAPHTPAAAQTGTVVRVSPSLITLQPGDIATVEIWVDNVDDLFGFALEIHFDPSNILVQSTALGNFLEPGLTVKDEIDNINGIIQFDMVQLGQDTLSKSGSGDLLTFEITLIESISTTNLTIVSILLTDRNGVEIPCDIESGIVMMSEYSVFLPLVMQ